MAIASYFSKNLLALNQLVRSNNELLLEVMSAQYVGIAFGDNAIKTPEGAAALDLTTRLLARFFPKLGIIDLSDNHSDRLNELVALAQRINSKIEITSDRKAFDSVVIVGKVEESEIPAISQGGMRIHFGANGWNAILSPNVSVPFSNSANPFGSGVAACLAASILFRHVFRSFLDAPLEFSDFSFSTYHLKLNGGSNPSIGQVEFDDVVLVGLGAIGSGCVWALSKIQLLSGRCDLVDPERIAESNLQRYVMSEEKDIGQRKAPLAASLFHQAQLAIVPHDCSWAVYMSKRKNFRINCVGIAVDNAMDRIGIQSSLPRVVFNSFTEPEVIGISRHVDFLNSACVGCGYVPIEKTRDYINEVADNLNIPDHADLIKGYLNRQQTVDEILLTLIAQANNIDLGSLRHFSGQPIDRFYSEFVCGGILLSLTGSVNRQSAIDAPLAFQSALAGILLASELVKFFSGSVNGSEQRTDLYPLQSIGTANPMHRPLFKDKTMRCICQDATFRTVYENKWKSRTATQGRNH